MTRSAQAKILIIVVFVVGALSGVVLSDLYETRVVRGDNLDGGYRSLIGGQSVTDYLELTEAQRDELSGVLETSRQDFDALRAETRPMYRALRADSRDAIRELLTPEQLEKYNRFVEQLGEDQGIGRIGR